MPGDDQITNADEQKEIVNEPNYKTDREEERAVEKQPESIKPIEPPNDEEPKKTQIENAS